MNKARSKCEAPRVPGEALNLILLGSRSLPAGRHRVDTPLTLFSRLGAALRTFYTPKLLTRIRTPPLKRYRHTIYK